MDATWTIDSANNRVFAPRMGATRLDARGYEMDCERLSFGDDFGALEGGMAEQEGELLATVTGDKVAGAVGAGFVDPGDMLQTGIAAWVAVGVVDLFEMIHVNHE